MRCTSVLVVEDNKEIRDVVEETLRLEGFRVYSVQNGKEAITALKMIPGRALVLLDMMMPVMDGWEFLTRYSSGQVINEISPVLVVSALGANAALVPKFSAVPAVGYIKKPFDVENLVHMVGQYCERVEAAPMALEAVTAA